MLRVLKFYQKDYRIPLDSLAAVIARAMTGIDFQQAEATGNDNEKGWTHLLTGLLREVDPSIDPTHGAHLPTEIEKEERNKENEEIKTN